MNVGTGISSTPDIGQMVILQFLGHLSLRKKKMHHRGETSIKVVQPYPKHLETDTVK